MSPPASTLLLVIPAPLHVVGARILFDPQACNGILRWLDNFDRVILCAPLAERGPLPDGLRDLGALVPAGRLEIHTLPRAYTPLRCLVALPAVRRLLLTQIARASHLQFAIGGSWGDWGALGAILAARRGRKAAVWADRVESGVMRFGANAYRGPRRIYRRFNAWLAERLERHVIRRTAMGLFHGMDSYRAFARFSPDPHLVHNIHLGADYRIPSADLDAKATRPGDRLRIVYAGRVHPDKGPDDWIDTLARLGEKLPFSAIWYGDGPMLEAARRRVAELGLTDRIAFPGNIGDRDVLLAALRDADIFLFCHKTPESPRCLIEALLSGTPIVGYASDYAADLISAHGGGILTAGDPAALAAAVEALASNRERLMTLFRAAAADGYPMTDNAVFEHRSALIKRL